MQELLAKIKDKKPNYFDYFITLVIALAGVLVGLETNPALMAHHGELFRYLDLVIVLIFVAELALKMGLWGRRPWLYFVNPEHLGDSAAARRRRLNLEHIDFWHVFDFAIVVLCLLPHVLPVHIHTRFLPFLRIARLLRLLRLAEELQQLHILVGALLKSLPSIAYICLFLSLHFYVYSVAGAILFAQSDPEHFRSLGVAMLTLFEIATGNGFSQIMHEAIGKAQQFDYSAGTPIFYFISFVVLGVMVILNLFIGVITAEMSALRNALAEQESKQEKARALENDHEILTHIQHLEEQVEKLRESLGRLRHFRRPPS
jgi:voltage-gated sodium channel